MIATLAEIKTLLGISDTTKDAQITALIPLVEDDLLTYCNNTFESKIATWGGSLTPTQAGTVYTFVGVGFSDSLIVSGDYIRVSGTLRNDGYYHVTNVTDTVITVDTATINEPEVSAHIAAIEIPAALKIYFSKMIGWNLYNFKSGGMSSESIGNYSYSMKDGGTGDAGYPADILKGLDRWRLLSTKRGTVKQQFRDGRGVTNVLREDIELGDMVGRK